MRDDGTDRVGIMRTEGLDPCPVFALGQRGEGGLHRLTVTGGLGVGTGRCCGEHVPAFLFLEDAGSECVERVIRPGVRVREVWKIDHR